MNKTQILDCLPLPKIYNRGVMIPKTIGRYRIKAELGRGGMSTVYLAHDPHFDRDVAIKLLPVELTHHSTFRRRFEREAKVVAALDDPAIVPVYDFGEEKGQPYLVMRFMTGGSLAERLHQGALSLEEASRILSRMAPALDEVHSHNVVHRDLKPSNILFDQRNEPYISDFGTVKMSKATTQLTDTGGAVGTPAYMSPEQIQGEVELDGRSDIYTLGIILYEMLSGKHPYQTNTPIAVAVKHMFEPIPHILDSKPNLPPECQMIIDKAVAKIAEERYETAVALANALQTITSPRPIVKQMTTHDLTPPPQKCKLALIISNANFEDETIKSLIQPAASIKHLADVLADPAIGAFDDVSTLVNESAATVRRTISHFFAGKERDDLLLLYIIGHAVVNLEEKLYLAAQDTEHQFLRGTAVPTEFIADEMDHSESYHQILVLDCTFSQITNGEQENADSQKPILNGEPFHRNGHERIVLAANDKPQYQWQSDSVTGSATPSLFTHYLIEGLKTGAADTNASGQISVDELFAYISRQVAQNSNVQADSKPRKWVPFAYQDAGDIVFAHNPHSSGSQKVDMMSPAIPPSRRPRLKRNIFVVTAVILLLLLIFSGGRNLIINQNQPQEAKAALPLSEPTNTASATVTAVSSTTTPTPTFSPTATRQTATPLPTNTPVPATLTVVPSQSDDEKQATAVLSSSLFSQPDSDTPELTF
ncbi:MAG: protein kinase, partial [Chloroflexi bacterium]|nr:protein kinase [Chloroflexota bacterium]